MVANQEQDKWSNSLHTGICFCGWVSGSVACQCSTLYCVIELLPRQIL